MEAHTLYYLFCPTDGVGWFFERFSIPAAVRGAIGVFYWNEYRTAGRFGVFCPIIRNDGRLTDVGSDSRPVWSQTYGGTFHVWWGDHPAPNGVCDFGRTTGFAEDNAGFDYRDNSSSKRANGISDTATRELIRDGVTSGGI